MVQKVLGPHQAQDLLRHCLEHGAIIPGKHFREELRTEGLDLVDAQHVLRTGCVYDPPEHDVKTGEWKYRVEGCEPEGKYLGIVFCFKSAATAFLITIFSIEARTRRR